jgi:ubiquinol oxidase
VKRFFTGSGAHVTTTSAGLATRHRPSTFSDHVAFSFTKVATFFADTFFAKRYGHRAVVLETIAAVPGMVGATLQHLKSVAAHAE